MRYERLIITAGGNSFELDLHPRLTVIAGVSQMERDGLVNELIGALGTGRNGVHLELTADSGGRFAIFRPDGARHRVVDVSATVDVTSRFADSTGCIDFLARAGLDVHSARRMMRFGPQDLVTDHERDRLIRGLAQVNQNELWVAAEALRQSRRRMEEAAESVGSAVEDAEVVEQIESRHAEFLAAQAATERRRKHTFLLSGFAAIATFPAVAFVGVWTAIPLTLLAAVAVIASIRAWRRAESARLAETEALAAAGAQTYLGFHLQRVNGLLSSDQARKRLMRASEELRAAQQRWSVIAGDVDLDWVQSHRDDIATAVRLRQDVLSMGVTGGAGGADGDEATALAQALIAKLNQLRRLGPGGESFPAFLDEPFAGIDPTITPSMLDLVVRSSQHQQIVLLTEDPMIASWARLESMTGALALVEPSSATPATTDQAGRDMIVLS